MSWLKCKAREPAYICNVCQCFKGNYEDEEKQVMIGNDFEIDQSAYFDDWSIGHLILGFGLGLLYIWIKWWALLIIVLYSILFEFIENTTFGVKITKVVCFDPKYEGDLIGNSICDIVCNIVGGLFGILIVELVNEERIFQQS